MSPSEIQTKKPSEPEQPRVLTGSDWIDRLIYCWSTPEATGIAFYSQNLVQNDFLPTLKKH